MGPKWADLWAPCEQMQHDRSWRRHLTHSHVHIWHVWGLTVMPYSHTHTHTHPQIYCTHTPPRRVPQQQLRAELKRSQREVKRDKNQIRSQTWERLLAETPSCEERRHKLLVTMCKSVMNYTICHDQYCSMLLGMSCNAENYLSSNRKNRRKYYVKLLDGKSGAAAIPNHPGI